MTRRDATFAAMLSITMAASTFSLFAVAVLSSDLEAEFGLSKLQLGVIGAVNTGVGGLCAPLGGKVADALGGRFTMGVVLAGAAVSTAFAALSPSYLFLLGAMALAGIPQGWGNPATNKAIAAGIVSERRGLLTGIKQSGVQLAAFSSGFVLPFVSERVSWRAGLWLISGVSAIAMVGLAAVTTLDSAPRRAPASDRSSPIEPLSAFVYRVAVFGFLMGIVGGGIGRFLPLFAEEEVGFSLQRAGFLFGVSGLVAIPTRIIWGIVLDRGFSPRRALILLGTGAAVSCMLLFGSAGGNAPLLWLATIVSGVTVGSWNTAANLAMIRQNDGRGAGRASGVLLLGFLLGLTVGSPAVGWSIDHFERYEPAWAASAVACLLATAVIARRRTTDPRRYSWGHGTWSYPARLRAPHRSQR